MEKMLEFTAISGIFSILGALIILLVGLFIAKKVADKLGDLLGKCSCFDFFKEKVFKCEKSKENAFLKIIVKFIYYVFVIFVIIAAAEKLGLTQFTAPLNGLLENIFLFIPNILGGMIFLVVAFIIAKLAGYFTLTLLEKVKLDEKLKLGPDTSISKALSDVVYILVFIFLLPGVLSSLKLDSVLAPLTLMIEKFMGYIPNIIAAIIVLGIGWFIASKIKDAIKGIIDSLNIEDKLVFSGKKLFDGNLGKIAGNIVYVLILIPVFTASLGYIGLEHVIQPVVDTMGIMLSYIPSLIGVVILLSVAGFFGQILEGIAFNLLKGIGFDGHLEKVGLKSKEDCYSRILSKFVKVLILYFALLQSIEILGFVVLRDLSYGLTTLLGSILLGVLIIGLGVIIANCVAKLIVSTDIKNKNLISTIAKVAILTFVGAMGLRQMGIANEIINMAFGFILGSIAVALAIAFGIGGRDIAAKKLEELDKCLKEDKKEDE